MIGMQYEIVLPGNFDMNVIEERVKENGHKTDGFESLFLKFYLVGSKNRGLNKSNLYCPLYLWKDHQGMNKFIFDGFYDNILNSFGWQNVNIGVPYLIDLNENFTDSKFVIKRDHKIIKQEKMNPLKFSLEDNSCIGKILIYNPDKWTYSEFYFYEKQPVIQQEFIFEILHISK